MVAINYRATITSDHNDARITQGAAEISRHINATMIYKMRHEEQV
jgi:hypothetical protein